VTEPSNSSLLTGKQRSFLRALSHPLKPLVQIGHGGLTDAVLTAIDAALQIHELIKVRVTGNDELAVAEIAPEVAKRTRSSIAQIIGKTLVLYRGRKKDPVIVLPKVGAQPSQVKSAKTKPPKGTK
jgi:RNA-binding protein